VLKQPGALLARLDEVGFAPEGVGVTRGDVQSHPVDLPSLDVTHWRATVRLASATGTCRGRSGRPATCSRT